MEEGQNQPEYASKRIKFQEIVEKKEGDGINALSNYLLLKILSHLPSTKDAIRTETLSKRWKHLWPWVHTLVFKHSDDPPTQFHRNPNSRSDFVSFVNKTLTQCRQTKLKKFQVSTSYRFTSYDHRFESHVNRWIRYAISCNVEELHLEFLYTGREAALLLDQKIFINSCFTDLRLAGSPILETLELGDCYGYRRLDITSKSIKNLVFTGYFDPNDEVDNHIMNRDDDNDDGDHDDLIDTIEINAPNILSLTIKGDLWSSKLLLLNLSSLVEANLDYTFMGHWEATLEEKEEQTLEGFILNLLHVKELKVGSFCSKRTKSRFSKFWERAFVFMGESDECFVDAMDTVEEGQNQVPNPIEFMEEEEDRISALPDYLLVEILSRLHSIESAITAGTLSKRWKCLWTLIPTLLIINNKRGDILDFVSSINKTLSQRPQFKLKKFLLNIFYDGQYESQVKSWIRYAISCNVEQLSLSLCNKDYDAEFVLDQSFFLCSCFTNLRLGSCLFNPVGAISWKNLRKLCIRWGNLDEDLIENILSGSPQLESLILTSCYGFRRLNITSKSVKNLVFCGYFNPNAGVSDYIIIEINAPNILSLAIQGDLDFQKLLLVNVSPLLNANLDYFTNKVTTPEEAEEEMLKGLILNLSHAKDLHIWTLCSQVLSRLEAKGFIFPSNMKFYDAYFVSAN